MSEPAKEKPTRLGRGLSALIGEVEAAPRSDTGPPPAPTDEISIDHIGRNPSQPRRHFDEGALKELASSVKEKGVLQAILVRPDPKTKGKYQIIAGERRWRAAKLAGLKSIPAIVRDMDELELLEVGIIENVQREDLNPIEEAEAYGALMKRFGRTQDGLAKSVGKSRVHIANTLRLLQLPAPAREHLRQGRISAGHARAALGAPDPAALIELAASKGLSVREIEAMAKRARQEEEGGVNTQSSSAEGAHKDVDTRALEEDLVRTLGLNVDIRHGKSGGELRIKYRSLEQLDDVCRRLTAKR